MNLKKIIIGLVLSISILIPNMVSATLPDFNPVCWTEDACIKIRMDKNMFGLSRSDAKDGFYPNEGDCTGSVGSGKNESVWGKCIPGTVAKLEIGIGGKTEIKHVGEYIQVIYYYALGIAGIIAVVMIMIAGIQWIVAAGNSAVIGASKKRIGGALVGLFLAYSSFFILNSINPWLTKFRLPQMWLIKKVEMMPEFCIDMESIEKAPGVSFAMVKDSKADIDKKISSLKPSDFSIKVFQKPPNSDGRIDIIQGEDLKCHQRFTPANGGGATCQGNYCDGKKMCAPNFKDNEEGKNPYICKDAMVVGKVYGGYFIEPSCSPFTEGFIFPYLVNGKLFAICDKTDKNSDKNIAFIDNVEIKEIEEKKITSFYVSNKNLSKVKTACSSIGDLKGFAFAMNFDEACKFHEMHWVGKGGIDLGLSSEIKEYGIDFETVSVNKLFTKEEIVRGLYFNINASNIKDIDLLF